MQYSEVKQGRVFVLRLEDGEIVHEEIERFAREQSITAAAMIIIGGADKGSKLVVGSERGRSQPINPMEHILDNVHEIAGTGTLFPDEEGNPVVHMHIACGRNAETVTGCIRNGVKVSKLGDVVSELTLKKGVEPNVTRRDAPTTSRGQIWLNIQVTIIY